MAPQEAAPDDEQVNCLQLYLLFVQGEEGEPLGWYFVRSVTEVNLLGHGNLVAAASTCERDQLPSEVHVPSNATHAHPCISLQPFVTWCEDMIATQATGSNGSCNPIPPPPPMPAKHMVQDAVPGGQKRGGWGPRCEALMNAYKRGNYDRCDELIGKYERILRG